MPPPLFGEDRTKGRSCRAPFYSDVREETRFVRDDDRTGFNSFDAAECEAAAAAAEIGWDGLAKGDSGDVTVEFRNEHHHGV
jgi:hypothetical protein